MSRQGSKKTELGKNGR